MTKETFEIVSDEGSHLDYDRRRIFDGNQFLEAFYEPFNRKPKDPRKKYLQDIKRVDKNEFEKISYSEKESEEFDTYYRSFSEITIQMQENLEIVEKEKNTPPIIVKGSENDIRNLRNYSGGSDEKIKIIWEFENKDNQPKLKSIKSAELSLRENCPEGVFCVLYGRVAGRSTAEPAILPEHFAGISDFASYAQSRRFYWRHCERYLGEYFRVVSIEKSNLPPPNHPLSRKYVINSIRPKDLITKYNDCTDEEINSPAAYFCCRPFLCYGGVHQYLITLEFDSSKAKEQTTKSSYIYPDDLAPHTWDFMDGLQNVAFSWRKFYSFLRFQTFYVLTIQDVKPSDIDHEYLQILKQCTAQKGVEKNIFVENYVVTESDTVLGDLSLYDYIGIGVSLPSHETIEVSGFKVEYHLISEKDASDKIRNILVELNEKNTIKNIKFNVENPTINLEKDKDYVVQVKLKKSTFIKSIRFLTKNGKEYFFGDDEGALFIYKGSCLIGGNVKAGNFEGLDVVFMFSPAWHKEEEKVTARLHVLDEPLTKRFQHYLNKHGRNVTEDGSMGIDSRRAVQNFLGFDIFSVDGVLGEKTSTAFRKWLNSEAKKGNFAEIDEFGPWDAEDSLIALKEVLKRWDVEEARPKPEVLDPGLIKELQKFLNASGRNVTVDGVFGLDSRKALQHFLGLANFLGLVDGVLGPNSAKAFRAWLNKTGKLKVSAEGNWDAEECVLALRSILKSKGYNC